MRSQNKKPRPTRTYSLSRPVSIDQRTRKNPATASAIPPPQIGSRRPKISSKSKLGRQRKPFSSTGVSKSSRTGRRGSVQVPKQPLVGQEGEGGQCLLFGRRLLFLRRRAAWFRVLDASLTPFEGLAMRCVFQLGDPAFERICALPHPGQRTSNRQQQQEFHRSILSVSVSRQLLQK